ncbi:hypothetical protein Syun_021104 [Stephania yunnanensis]|uniref:Uncharacterized protein n=1 Tax=Stephania yunnanensis TaxID=152371 RepID=A0AAP0NNV1_9MAGN
MQRVNNDRGVALKLLRLSGNGRQQVLIPEGVKKDGERWVKLIEALKDRYAGTEKGSSGISHDGGTGGINGQQLGGRAITLGVAGTSTKT